MAQLSLFTSRSPSRPTATPTGHDATDRRPRPYHVPVYRVTLVRETAIPAPAARLRSAAHAAELLRQYLGAVDREHFVVILLDRKNAPIGINTVSIGSLTASVVHPREVFKSAILANAAAILCGHNHPSGAPRSAYVERIQ